VGAGASDIAVGDTAVWVTNDRAGTITSVDPVSMKVGSPWPVPGGGGSAVAAAAGMVWVLDRADRAVVPIDARTGRR
jgi:streptogramin lyase